MNSSNLVSRPPTNKMLEALMDCHERELMNLEPYDVGNLYYATGLIQRGMLGTRPYITKTGKKIIAFYVTIQGKAYLNTL
jgi:hypothetical protein